MSELKTIVRHLVLVAASGSVVGCDRVTKHLATEILGGGPVRSYLSDTVRLSYAENAGSFLGLGSELPHPVRFAVFVVAAGLMLGVLVVCAVRRRWTGAKLLGAALMAGGGASNLADRAIDGRVVDFLNVGMGPIRTGIFNIADMALVAGLAVLLATWSSRSRRRVDRASGFS